MGAKHRARNKPRKQTKKKKKENGPASPRTMLETHLLLCDEDQIALDALVDEHGKDHILVRFN